MNASDLAEDYLVDPKEAMWSPEIISRPSKFNIV
jgi:hypothetical protein